MRGKRESTAPDEEPFLFSEKASEPRESSDSIYRRGLLSTKLTVVHVSFIILNVVLATTLFYLIQTDGSNLDPHGMFYHNILMGGARAKSYHKSLPKKPYGTSKSYSFPLQRAHGAGIPHQKSMPLGPGYWMMQASGSQTMRYRR